MIISLIFMSFIVLGIIFSSRFSGCICMLIGVLGIGISQLLHMLWMDISVEHLGKYMQAKCLIEAYKDSPSVTKKEVARAYDLMLYHNTWYDQKYRLDNSLMLNWISQNKVSLPPKFDVEKTMRELNKKQLTK